MANQLDMQRESSFPAPSSSGEPWIDARSGEVEIVRKRGMPLAERRSVVLIPHIAAPRTRSAELSSHIKSRIGEMPRECFIFK
jgi:hypothetical protein